MNIGSVIKKLRKAKGLKQSDIAGDFMSVKQLSRIEKNVSTPSYDTLNWLSLQLSSELIDYIPYDEDKNLFEIKSELDRLKNYYEGEQYHLILDCLDKSKYAYNTKSHTANLEYRWLKDASLFNLNRKDEIDVNLLYKSLDRHLNKANLLTIFKRPLRPIEYKIVLIIIALRDSKTDAHLEKQGYKLAIQNFEDHHNHISNPVYLIYCYNLSRQMFYAENYKEAIFYGEKGIANCQQNNVHTFIRHLYNIVGKANYRLGNIEIGIQQMRHYISLTRVLKCEIIPSPVIDNLIDNYQLWPMTCAYCQQDNTDNKMTQPFKLLI